MMRRPLIQVSFTSTYPKSKRFSIWRQTVWSNLWKWWTPVCLLWWAWSRFISKNPRWSKIIQKCQALTLIFQSFFRILFLKKYLHGFTNFFPSSCRPRETTENKKWIKEECKLTFTSAPSSEMHWFKKRNFSKSWNKKHKSLHSSKIAMRPLRGWIKNWALKTKFCLSRDPKKEIPFLARRAGSIKTTKNKQTNRYSPVKHNN